MNKYETRRHEEKKKLFLAAIIIVYTMLFGCLPGPIAAFVKDVSERSDLWGGYRYNGIYKLKLDVFLIENSDYPTPNKLVLVAPRNATRGIYDLFNSPPMSIKEYLKDKSKWEDVISIVRKNTRIKCTRLLKYITIGYGNSLYIQAVILDGPMAGKKVEIGDLSLSKFNKEVNLYLLSPNPKLLSFEGAS